jgi:hypothetical protein
MSSPDLTSNDSLLPTRPTHSRTPRRGLIIGGLVLVFVVAVALPLIFLPISEDVTGAHTTFHILGILTCAAGIALLHFLRRKATRTVTVLSWIVTITLIGWLVGHLGELVSVFTEGGVAHDSDTFDHASHIFFANIAVPSWMLTILTFLVLLIAIAIQAITRRTRGARARRTSTASA